MVEFSLNGVTIRESCFMPTFLTYHALQRFTHIIQACDNQLSCHIHDKKSECLSVELSGFDCCAENINLIDLGYLIVNRKKHNYGTSHCSQATCITNLRGTMYFEITLFKLLLNLRCVNFKLLKSKRSSDLITDFFACPLIRPF